MSVPAEIAILDDDQAIRLARYALSGPGEISTQWIRNYFLPEEVDPATVYAAGDGLHACDGVRLLPLSTNVRLRSGSDVSILILRRGIVDAGLIDANPRLRLIQRLGERADGIDLATAARRGIAVSCWPRPTHHYTAEQAILLMLALAKKLIQGDRAVRVGRWDRARVHAMDGVAYNWTGLSELGGLFGATVGIIGMGEVGSVVATLARGFGARVIYTNRTRLAPELERQFGVEGVSLAQLLAQSDFVTVHAQNLPANRGMIGADTFSQMKRSAFFINASRGRMVDEDALYVALTDGAIAGAALDVHFDEPRPTPDKYSGLENVILTPHLAAGSRRGVLDEIGVCSAIVGPCRRVSRSSIWRGSRLSKLCPTAVAGSFRRVPRFP
jgi:phosphoglycerate dehydrogenase-like enzyme